MGYVAQTLEAGLSFKEKAIKHSIGPHIHSIVIKLIVQVGLIKFCVKISYVA